MIFDIEGDGLTPTKIYVLSYLTDKGEVKSVHTYEEMRHVLRENTLLVGHNIIRYDVPVLEKILGIDLSRSHRIVDTLALSWYLFPERNRHGLENWGADLGVKKPEIDDWHNLSIEEYTHRCEEDVRINNLLYQKQIAHLHLLYGSEEKANRLIGYLTFKLQCAQKQEAQGWRLDVGKVEEGLARLVPLIEKKYEALREAMPPHLITTKREKPTKPFKKDGTLSAAGARWFDLLRKQGLPEDHTEPLKAVVGEEPANPGSHQQVKDWLFSLGWEPATFKYVKEEFEERTIPQVRVDNDGVKELCDSVLLLAKKEPAILELQELTVLEHRVGILRSFLENEEGGRVKAEIAGLTNTLRFKHKVPCVNLPGVGKPYGDLVRGCLIADDGYILCGSDKSSLEENTKRHYIYPFDPEYVKEMSRSDFDAHLDLAKQAGEITDAEIQAYMGGDKSFKPVRNKYKPANYACVYGVAAPKLSRTTGLSLEEAQKLIDVYWKRNWAIKEVVQKLTVKSIKGQKWLYNPVSGFWYSLRYEKDRFSTLNQGTGVYCFDTWVHKVVNKGMWPIGQFHDEIILQIPQDEREVCKEQLMTAIKETNDVLKLNVELGIDVQFGNSYAEIH